ncbi:hypothetical protein PVAP13_7KG184655 [Panicum virgatum]|uniref:Uncharacterized protein n=1 Tax=Panicum virgatum TaxID=38727 RepID=A0A8T0QEV2_PANVG|nr:hypothetical protein PVAP13_7KG184655 [Panicum virgatum]KAG2572531.1 hypothetical protein PVAP13_7KG184655 [Panicum virgatum]
MVSTLYQLENANFLWEEEDDDAIPKFHAACPCLVKRGSTQSDDDAIMEMKGVAASGMSGAPILSRKGVSAMLIGGAPGFAVSE